MIDDETLAKIGITKEECEEAFLRLCNHGYLERLDEDGEISYRRTEKPFHKLEWAQTPPRIRQFATVIMTKVMPMIIKENEKEIEKEIDDTLREMERDGLIESKQGDGDIILSLTAKGRARNPWCDYTL